MRIYIKNHLLSIFWDDNALRYSATLDDKILCGKSQKPSESLNPDYLKKIAVRQVEKRKGRRLGDAWKK